MEKLLFFVKRHVCFLLVLLLLGGFGVRCWPVFCYNCAVEQGFTRNLEYRTPYNTDAWPHEIEDFFTQATPWMREYTREYFFHPTPEDLPVQNSGDGCINFRTPTVIHYYALPDMNSEIVYTLEPGTILYLSSRLLASCTNTESVGSGIIYPMFGFPTNDKNWRYACTFSTDATHIGVGSEGPYYVKTEDLLMIAELVYAQYLPLAEETPTAYTSYTLDEYCAQTVFTTDLLLYHTGIYISPYFYRPYFEASIRRFLSLLVCAG